jgi:uncharacterized membrane protein YdjX (TVP38/TMEM64 family)
MPPAGAAPTPGEPAPQSRLAWRRFAPLAVLAAALIGFLALGGAHYLSFSALAEHRADLRGLVAQWGPGAVLAYIGLYAFLVALSVPGAAILTVAGGFLFGTWLGGACAVIGATIGATVVFLAARVGLGGLVQRAGPLAQRLEAGFRANAFGYLLFLRLVPLFPFWLVNLVPAVLGIELRAYVAATFLGIIPVGFVYAGLGNGLGSLLAARRGLDLGIVFRPIILLPIVALALLSLLPIAVRRRRR